jgi:RNA polymerase sigma-70 factor, ECF subfamily
MPWISAVYRFAIRLTRGDEEAAQDLVQETYLRAFRAWHQFERGTNCRSWLFTICKNTFLRERERARTQREITESELDADTEMIAAVSSFGRTVGGVPGADLFDHVIDAQVVSAIDALPDDFREVLVLSDLGDLTYGEIAEVIDIPVGTVKSRLFRARRLLQQALVTYAIDAGYVREESA